VAVSGGGDLLAVI